MERKRGRGRVGERGKKEEKNKDKEQKTLAKVLKLASGVGIGKNL